MHFPEQIRFTVFLTVSLLALAGCGGGPAAGSDDTEKIHPRIEEAKEKVKLQDPDGAINVLRELLREEPDFAYAHLQLGFAYQMKQQPVEALYHFNHYLRARPDSENAAVVESVVRDEMKRLARNAGVVTEAADLPANVSELQENLATTRYELARARVLLERAEAEAGGTLADLEQGWTAEKLELLRELEALRSSSGRATTLVSPGEPDESIPGRTYTVQRGDNLSRIAQKMYGRSSAWRMIYDANRDVLPDTRALRPGQTLVIPAAE